MSKNFEITAEKRDDMGKGASRRLRRAEKIPAIIYGGGQAPQSLTIDHNSIWHHLENEAFYSHILKVKIGSKSSQAVLKDVQRHPGKPTILHIDLLRVSANEKVKMHVPLHFIGEDVAPGVKSQGGSFSHHMADIEVSCLPKDLPEYLEVDVSALELGSSIHYTEIDMPKGVEIVALTHGEGHDQAIVSIQKMRGMSVESDEEATDEEAAEEAKEGKDGEGS